MDPNLLQAIMAYLSQMAQGGQDPMSQGQMQEPMPQGSMMDPMSQGSISQDPMAQAAMMQEPMAQEQPQGLPPGIGKILAAVLASMQQQGALQQAPTLGTASSMSNVP